MRAWLAAGLLLLGGRAGAACEVTTVFVDSMEPAGLVLTGPGERVVELAVRVADEPRERSAGFQHICPATIEQMSIYFVFERPRVPSFHMRNVKAPLDIAFMDADGMIIDIQRMDPYVLGAARETYYRPPRRVSSALETRAGFFAARGIDAGGWYLRRRDDGQ